MIGPFFEISVIAEDGGVLPPSSRQPLSPSILESPNDVLAVTQLGVLTEEVL
jgi:hypothetical protein